MVTPVRGTGRLNRQPPGATRGLDVLQPLSEQPLQDASRLCVGMGEIDRLLGGGIVPGTMLLLAGDPGIGKSTLLLQIASSAADSGGPAVYLSGEESGPQVRLRSGRLGLSESSLLFTTETEVNQALALLNGMKPSMVIVDSVQTMFTEDNPAVPGSVVQVRECAQILLKWAKTESVPILLAGHVTKDGSVAGPRILEHIVDVVLTLEGDPSSGLRVLRCTKNRFGSTNDIAMFQMLGDGLSEVTDPSAELIGERRLGVPGSAITVVLEGTRALLTEIQALTNRSTLNPPRRTANGLDFNRMVLLTAVLARRSGVYLAEQDVIINVPGGLRLTEPAADLGVALAVTSSLRDIPIPSDIVCIGEIGLNGEIRGVSHIDRRISEAYRHGFRRAIVPSSSVETEKQVRGIEVLGVDNLAAALSLVFDA